MEDPISVFTEISTTPKTSVITCSKSRSLVLIFSQLSRYVKMPTGHLDRHLKCNMSRMNQASYFLLTFPFLWSLKPPPFSVTDVQKLRIIVNNSLSLFISNHHMPAVHSSSNQSPHSTPFHTFIFSLELLQNVHVFSFFSPILSTRFFLLAIADIVFLPRIIFPTYIYLFKSPFSKTHLKSQWKWKCVFHYFAQFKK